MENNFILTDASFATWQVFILIAGLGLVLYLRLSLASRNKLNASRLSLLCSFLILVLAGCAQKEQAQKSQTDEWALLWADEFETDGAPDPAKWGFAPRKSADWACYCADTLATTFVKDGQLYLRAIVNRDPADTAKYKTACIQTKNKFSFKYGKVEVRAKLDKGKGSWPAIWMMPQEAKFGGWPHSGEIDIMEHLNFDTVFYQTLHSGYIDRLNQKTNPVYFATAPFQVGEFNTFGLEWYPDRLDFFVNGRKTFTYPKVAGVDPSQWPFDEDFFIILDQAVGGNWVGKIHDEDLPVQMAVDWVRVYQPK